MALEGQQTPANKAGVEIEEKNKWMDLLKRSTNLK
jgi:hypothetical protein